MIWVIVLGVVVVGFYIFKYRELQAENTLLAWFDHRIPTDSRFYFERATKQYCQRCGVGIIWRRYRYELIGNGKGGTTVRGLTGLYRCDKCHYRGLSLKKFT